MAISQVLEQFTVAEFARIQPWCTWILANSATVNCLGIYETVI